MRPLASPGVRVGPYRLLAELGSGGMGRVYLGSGPDGSLVAVKQIDPRYADDEGFRARFGREVDACRRVSGAYTAAVVAADPGAPAPWLASVYVPGPSLAETLEAIGVLPADTAMLVAARLASALEDIHRAGLVHRDLKPSNVLLAEDGLRVIDFGIVRAVHASTETTLATVPVGSPSYMSPEQALSRPVTTASDIFSLGTVLVVASTGTNPFAVPSHVHATLHNVVEATPDLSAVPPRLRPIVQRCLAKDPADRPTPAQLLESIGTLTPTQRPWPAAVYEQIGRRRAELDRLLAGPEGGAAAPDGAPTAPRVVPPDPTRPYAVDWHSGQAFEAATVPGTTPAPGGPARRRRWVRVLLPIVGLLAAGTVAAFAVGPDVLKPVWDLVRDDPGSDPTGTSARKTTGPGTTAEPSQTASPSTTDPGEPTDSPSPEPTEQEPPDPPAGPVYGLDGKCIDVAGGNTADGTRVQLYTCNDTAAQTWTLGADGTLQALDKCLDVANGGLENGALVQLHTCNGTAAQQWVAVDGQLVNPQSGLCLDVPGRASDDGTQLHLWGCHGGDNQQWQLPS